MYNRATWPAHTHAQSSIRRQFLIFAFLYFLTSYMGEKRRGERFNPIFLAVQSIRAGGQLGKRALVPLHIPSSCNICLLLPTPPSILLLLLTAGTCSIIFFSLRTSTIQNEMTTYYTYTRKYIKEILKNRLAVKLITSAWASRYIGASFWMRSILHFSRTYFFQLAWFM